MIRPQRDARASLLHLQQQQQRKGWVAGAGRRDAGDDALDLFSRNRRSVPVAGDHTDRHNRGGPKTGSALIESAKLPRGGIDDLLLASDMGKHDYDWLLTPPGTPLRSSMDSSDHQLISIAPRSNPSARPSISTTKASRFSLSQTENNQPTKPARSNSVTRSAVSAYSSHFSSNSNKTSLLNTSTASVTSFRQSTPTRPATPTRRTTPASTPTSTSISRQTTPASRPVSSRPSTPSKARPALTSPGDKTRNTQTPSEKPRSLHASRPSTPTSRPQISSSSSSLTSSVVRPQVPASLNSSLNSTVTRSSSRPSTPTRRTPTISAPAARSSSVGRVPSMNARNAGPPSRPSSPGPKPRPTVQPIVPPNFPLDAPPNLRTKVPERPVSAGRTRPGTALTVRANLNSEPPLAVNPSRRQSASPIVTRGRFPENSPRARTHTNGQSTPPETQKIPGSDGSFKKPAKTVSAMESTGFGRTISKKSLDMAMRHMDIRQSMGSIRSASLFPQSIRSASKGHPARRSDSLVYPSMRNGNDTEDVNCNGTISGSGSVNDGFSENGDGVGSSPDGPFLMGRAATEPDVFESSRYDTILLKEDLKNMSWLHSIDDKSDHSLVFDHRFEPPPEPFELI